MAALTLHNVLRTNPGPQPIGHYFCLLVYIITIIAIIVLVVRYVTLCVLVMETAQLQLNRGTPAVRTCSCAGKLWLIDDNQQL